MSQKKKTTCHSNLLYPHQQKAIKMMHNGCILNGGVGTGKSRTGLFYYYKEQGGRILSDGTLSNMNNPKDLYIITTAMKRDSLEWEFELVPFNLKGAKVVIDSWQNIKKYKDIYDSFFIFDEDRVTGYGSWVKTFLNITRKNQWIILSATPGDTWEQYIPVFIANGFYKNKSEFTRRHCVYSKWTKFPKIEKYIDTGVLIKHRRDILIDMSVNRTTKPHHVKIFTEYDKDLYKTAIKDRWDPFKQEPIEQPAQLCYVLRKIVNSDESRQMELLTIAEKTPKLIIFYKFDYELDILKSLPYMYDGKTHTIAEWNGHKHEPIPKCKRWVYLVNYGSGAEGWNCIETDTIIFYSQDYSYKTMIQAAGRIDRMNTKFIDLYYYHFKSHSSIDNAIAKALNSKKSFNESAFVNSFA